MAKTSAGNLGERITFQRRIETDDGYGNPIAGPWADHFTVAARLQPRLGSEAVLASRLQGVQPYLLTVYSSSQARQVTPAWRAVNARSGKVYDIKTVANVDERNAMLEMLVVESGG